MKKVSKITVGLLFCVVTMMSSCVQGDLYELYDEELSLNNIIQKKITKDVTPSLYSCGVCCAAYILNGQNSEIEPYLGTVDKACGNLNLPSGKDYVIPGDGMAKLLNNLLHTESWNYLSRDATVDGVYRPNYYAQKLDSILMNGNYPIVVSNGNNHWLVAYKYVSEKGIINTVECTEVKCFDPQNKRGWGSNIDIHDIPCIVYK